MKTSASPTPTPSYRCTYPDDSEAEQRRNATTPKHYDQMMLRHFKEGSPCELCDEAIAMAITVQVHRRYKDKRMHTCIERDERFPVIEFYVCKKHANAAAFYELATTDWPASPHYMVLGSCPVPLDGMNQGPLVCVNCQKSTVKSRYDHPCYTCNRLICDDLPCWRVHSKWNCQRVCMPCIRGTRCLCDGTKDSMHPGTDLEWYRYCPRHSRIFADEKEQQKFIARIEEDLAAEKPQEEEEEEETAAAVVAPWTSLGTMSVENAGKTLGKLYKDKVSCRVTCLTAGSEKLDKTESLVRIETKSLPSFEILEANLALLLKQTPVQTTTTDQKEPLQWRWIMNASAAKANFAGVMLNRLGIRWIKSMPEFPDMETSTYDSATSSLTGFQVWCNEAEHLRLRTVTKVMQPHFT